MISEREVIYEEVLRWPNFLLDLISSLELKLHLTYIVNTHH